MSRRTIWIWRCARHWPWRCRIMPARVSWYHTTGICCAPWWISSMSCMTGACCPLMEIWRTTRNGLSAQAGATDALGTRAAPSPDSAEARRQRRREDAQRRAALSPLKAQLAKLEQQLDALARDTAAGAGGIGRAGNLSGRGQGTPARVAGQTDAAGAGHRAGRSAMAGRWGGTRGAAESAGAQCAGRSP